jgi:hypothetical protein
LWWCLFGTARDQEVRKRRYDQRDDGDGQHGYHHPGRVVRAHTLHGLLHQVRVVGPTMGLLAVTWVTTSRAGCACWSIKPRASASPNHVRLKKTLSNRMKMVDPRV